MSDRYCALTVTLIRDTRDDDAEHIMRAIHMIKGVQDVVPVLATPEMWIAEDRARRKLTDQIESVLYPTKPSSGTSSDA